MFKIKFPEVFVVVGTDTDVGKTVVSAVLMRYLEGTYWKPIQTGTYTDSQFIKEQIKSNRILKEAYLFDAPLAPSVASKLEGITVELDKIAIPKVEKGPLIIEGAGGIMTPLTEDKTYLDLLKQWKVPVVVVARSTLGTINHTLLTLRALESEGVPILGVIMNGPKNEKNKEAIEHFGKVRVIYELGFLEEFSNV